MTRVTNPDGTYTAYTYWPDGRKHTVSDAAGDATTYTYDAAKCLTSVEDPNHETTSYACDLAGEVITKTTQNGTTNYHYNADGTIKDEVGPTGTTSYGYDNDGRRTDVTDPDGNHTVYDYDALGRQTVTHLPDGAHTTVNAYDLAGQLLSYTDAGGKVTSYTYWPNGLKKTVTDPDQRATQYDYYPDGTLKTTTDAAQRVTTDVYDDADRITSVTYSDGTTPAVSYSYDDAGRRTTMTDGTGNTVYAYDSYGRLTGVTSGSSSIGYGYNNLGQIATIAYPDQHTVSRTYYPGGQLHTVADWNNNTTTFAYDGDENLHTTTYPNGVVQTITVNAADQVTGVTATAGTTTLASFGYTLKPSGLINSTTDSVDPALNQSAGYTSLDQLNALGGATSYQYDLSNNLTALPDGSTLGYDAAGQLTTRTPTSGSTTSYGFDGVGDRTSATTGANSQLYAYNQSAELTTYTPSSGQPTIFTYNGDELRATASGGFNATYSWDTLTASIPLLLSDGTNDYIYGPNDQVVEQVAADGTIDYLHGDRLGSVRLITDATGAVAATRSYDAYGNPLTTTGSAQSPFGYAGEYTDPSGLIYLRARYYDPATGQFLTVDPAIESTHAPYLYGGGDPINLTDPTGLKCHGWSFTHPLCDVGQGWHDTLGQHWRGAAQVGVAAVATAGAIACTAATAGICGGVIATIATTATIGAAAGAADYALSGGCHTAEGYLVSAGVGGLLGGVGGGVGEYASGAVDLVNGTATEGASQVAPDLANLSSKIERDLVKRGWTPQEIQDAYANGEQIPAVNKANGAAATRYVNPTTGKSVVIENDTGQVIHLGGSGFKYGPDSGDLP